MFDHQNVVCNVCGKTAPGYSAERCPKGRNKGEKPKELGPVVRKEQDGGGAGINHASKYGGSRSNRGRHRRSHTGATQGKQGPREVVGSAPLDLLALDMGAAAAVIAELSAVATVTLNGSKTVVDMGVAEAAGAAPLEMGPVALDSGATVAPSRGQSGLEVLLNAVLAEFGLELGSGAASPDVDQPEAPVPVMPEPDRVVAEAQLQESPLGQEALPGHAGATGPVEGMAEALIMSALVNGEGARVGLDTCTTHMLVEESLTKGLQRESGQLLRVGGFRGGGATATETVELPVKLPTGWLEWIQGWVVPDGSVPLPGVQVLVNRGTLQQWGLHLEAGGHVWLGSLLCNGVSSGRDSMSMAVSGAGALFRAAATCIV
jgi:hypothetical protein